MDASRPVGETVRRDTVFVLFIIVIYSHPPSSHSSPTLIVSDSLPESPSYDTVLISLLSSLVASVRLLVLSHVTREHY